MLGFILMLENATRLDTPKFLSMSEFFVCTRSTQPTDSQLN